MVSLQIPGIVIGDEIYRLRSKRVYTARSGGHRLAVNVWEGPESDFNNVIAAVAKAATLRVDGLGRILTIGATQDAVYWIREYVDGETLNLRLKKEPYDEEGVTRLAARLARVLEAIHGRGLVHRGLQPENIIIDAEGHAWLLDLAVCTPATYVLDGEHPKHFRDAVRYHAPEMAGMLQSPVDHRSDLYSLGVVLYQAATGRLPFESEDIAELVRAHAAGELASVKERRPEISTGLSHMIGTLLAKDPDERYQSATALLGDLQRLDELNNVLEDVGEVEASSLGKGVLQTHLVTWDLGPGRAFVGRDLELTRLACIWQSATEGQGTVVLVEGEEGSGKTRLLREFLSREVDEEAALVLKGEVVSGNFVPYATVAGALRRFVDELRLRPTAIQPRLRFRIRKALGERLDVLADLVPNSVSFFGINPNQCASESVNESRHNPYHERVAECLVRLAAAFPATVMIFEDVHRVEESSQRVFAALAGRLEGTRAMVVLTKIAENGVGTQLPLGLAGNLPSDRLMLAPLGLDAVEEIISDELGGQTPDPRFVAQLQRSTRGNPLAITRYLRLALKRGAIWPEGSVWYPRKSIMRRLVDPRDFQGLVQQGLDHLSPKSLLILGAAALLSRPFRAEEVLAMTDHHVDDFREAVAEASRLQIAERVSIDTWAFGRHRVVVSLRSRLDAATRAMFHGRAAHWMDGTPNSQSFERARHVALSDWPMEDTGRYRAVNVAGRDAVKCGDDASAFAFLEEARRISQARGIKLTSDVHKSLAKLSERAGQFEAAIGHLVSAIDHAETTVERAKLLGQVATNALLGRGDPILALTMATRALELSGFPMRRSKLRPCARALPVLQGLESHEPQSLEQTLTCPRGRQFVLDCVETCLVAGYLSGESSHVLYGLIKSLKKVARSSDVDAGTDASLLLCFAYTVAGKARRAVSALKRAKCNPLDGAKAQRYEALKVFARFRFERHVEVDPKIFSRRPVTPLGLLLTMEMAHGFWLRGHSEAARGLLRLVERLPNAIGGEGVRPALWHAVELLHGHTVQTPGAFTEDELEAATAPPSDYLRASSRSAAVIMELERGETASRLDLLCHQREAMGISIGADCLQLSDYRVYVGYVRLAQAMSQALRGRSVELAPLEGAIKRLAVPQPESLFLPHRLVLMAGLQRLQGRAAHAKRLLVRADQLARDWDNRWARFEGARLSACLLLDEGKAEAARTEAMWALHLAERFGWCTRAARIRKEFTVSLGGSSRHVADADVEATANRYRQQLDALLEVGLASSMLLEPSEQARVALDEIIRVFNAERAFLFVYDEEGASLKLNSGRNKEGQAITQVSGYKGRAVQQVWNSLEPVVIRGEGDAPGIMAAPLIARDRLLGVVYLDGSQSHSDRHGEDVQILLAIANHLAVTLETSRVNELEVKFASERRERRLAETLRTVANTLSTTLELSEVLARLLESLNHLIEYDRAMVLMRRDEAFEVAAARSQDGEILAGRSFDRKGYAALDEILEARRPLTLDEIPKEHRSRYPLGDKPNMSWMGVPLLRGMEVTGVLILTDERRGAYSAYDAEIAFTFAGQAAIALENARLFGEVERLAVIDELTGVYNRRAFFDLAQREFQRALRYQTPLAAIMIDLDNFKAVNDTRGHSAGDEVLATIAQRLQGGVRDLDVLGRYGGEEFVILAPQTGLAEACTVADRLRLLVASETVSLACGVIDVTASFGVAAIGANDATLSSLLDRADKALYSAKAEGKNCVRRYR